MRYPRWRDGLILDANRGAVSPVWEKKIKLKKKKTDPGHLYFYGVLIVMHTTTASTNDFVLASVLWIIGPS